MPLHTLLVDDDSIILMIHDRILTKNEWPGTWGRHLNGQSALHRIREAKPDERLLVMLDINMPVMNGWEFLDALKSQPAPCPIAVVMVTSSIDRQDHDKADTYDLVVDYLDKPLNADRIAQLLNHPKLAHLFA